MMPEYADSVFFFRDLSLFRIFSNYSWHSVLFHVSPGCSVVVRHLYNSQSDPRGQPRPRPTPQPSRCCRRVPCAALHIPRLLRGGRLVLAVPSPLPPGPPASPSRGDHRLVPCLCELSVLFICLLCSLDATVSEITWRLSLRV